MKKEKNLVECLLKFDHLIIIQGEETYEEK